MNQRGFTLIEMAIVLAIAGLLIGGGLIAVGPLIDQTRTTQTKTNMDQAESALLLFVIRNNRLPCPANGSLSNSNASYGLEVVKTSVYPNICDVGTVPLANSVIPWRTLGLDEQYSVDGWNNRLSYFPAGGQTNTGWDSLVDLGTPGSGATATATVNAAGNVTGLTVVQQGALYDATPQLPSVLLYGGGTSVTPPLPTVFLPSIAGTGDPITGFSPGSGGSGYSSAPSVVIGTAGCLYRNGGPVNGRWSECDGSLSGGTKTYLTPSYPYGNYIAVYALTNGACGNEITSPNFTDVTSVGTCAAAPTGTNLTVTTTVLQNVQYWGNRAAYVLISHGKSGTYAWTKGGTQILGTAYPLKAYNSAGTAGTTSNLGFVEGSPSGNTSTSPDIYFDDIVRWRSPAMIIQLCGSGACGNP